MGYYLNTRKTAIKLALLSMAVTMCVLVLIQNKVVYSPLVRSSTVAQYPEDTGDHADLNDPEESADAAIISEQGAMKKMVELVENLPWYYGTASKESKPKNMKNCANLPEIYDLHFNNDLWQVMETSNGTGYFYGAYYDDRVQKLSNITSPPLVHVLGMFNRLHPNIKSFCQLFFGSNIAAIEVPVLRYKLIWIIQWGRFKKYFGLYPYLLTCQLPKGFEEIVPQSVSIVEKSCGSATNNLIVKYQVPPQGEEKKDFAVCVKGLDFPTEDLSVRLIEWIETVRVLGAQKIFFYNLNSHHNIERTLYHYNQFSENGSSIGLVDVVPMTLAGDQSNTRGFQHYYLKKKTFEKRLGELVAYNDCFLTHMHEYKYIVLLDIDEVIVPIKDNSWKELIDSVSVQLAKTSRPERAALSVQNVYFLDEVAHEHKWYSKIPQHMHMLQHTYRMKNFTDKNSYIKCFHNTSRVLTVHNHFPFSCLKFNEKGDAESTNSGACLYFTVEQSDAQLNHYRSDCVSDLKRTCEKMKENQVLDLGLWRFKDVLVERVQSVIRILGLNV